MISVWKPAVLHFKTEIVKFVTETDQIVNFESENQPFYILTLKLSSWTWAPVVLHFGRKLIKL